MTYGELCSQFTPVLFLNSSSLLGSKLNLKCEFRQSDAVRMLCVIAAFTDRRKLSANGGEQQKGGLHMDEKHI